jgi:hypothetical protein
VSLELTICRKDGHSFRNLPSVQPVLDTDSVYRYSIGVLCCSRHRSARNVTRRPRADARGARTEHGVFP